MIGAFREFSNSGPVIENFNLKIEPGQFVSLLGPSGCGKSTILRLIAGLDLPNAGRVEINLKEIVQSGAPIDSIKSASRGFVFQDAHLLPWKTAIGNVGLPLELMKRPRTEIVNAAKAALVKVGLGDSLHKYPSQLSGGMKMRVSVARALVTEPRLLLLDEPFAALDENTRFRLQEDLRSLWLKSRMTVVFVTHSITEAAFLSDRALVLSSRPGRILLDHFVALPVSRGRNTRRDPTYLNEVDILSAAFRDVECE